MHAALIITRCILQPNSLARGPVHGRMMTMSSQNNLSEVELGRRYSDVDVPKLSGATYTPFNFATFVAKQMLRIAELPKRGPIRILDPAVGDGALLDALLKCLPAAAQTRVQVWGYDTDSVAIRAASSRLSKDFPGLTAHIEQKDFLEHVLTLQKGGDLFSSVQQQPFHLVIANPPYVRTQILGADQAQELAQSFGLTGRVDLYYPFLLGISRVLADGGVTGIITSNRFMTTKSGQAVRRALLSQFQIVHAWDLGDTKLFDAAVLPSVLLAKGTSDRQHPHAEGIRFSTIYETKDVAQVRATDALSALESDDDTVVEISDGRRYRVRHGTLENGGEPEGLWRIATNSGDTWLATVESNTWDTFRRVGKIRVGVKSTADKVFVRSDWASLPDGEPELLRPLLTRHWARRFRATVPTKEKHVKEILYPHEIVNGKRAAVNLTLYPKAQRYLEQHREVLEARTYVIEGGRNWFEIWVPHDPAAWLAPKLVFPDISDKPVFWMDTDGRVVNGECFWIASQNLAETDLLWLALAIANSTFIEAFYDHKFNNKLYAGRRRFVTQYVEQFPLPDPARADTQAIIAMTKEIYDHTPSNKADKLAAILDDLVWSVFGLSEKVAR